MLGHLVTFDLFECDQYLLEQKDTIELTIHSLAESIGATIVQIHTHHYEPVGLSCIAQISASHIAVHSWPENCFAAVDIFSCTAKIKIPEVIVHLREVFHAESITYKEIQRGRNLRARYFQE